MTSLLQAAKQALEALELHGKQYPHMVKGYCIDATTTLRQAIAQAEQNHSGDVNEMVAKQQEPFAWMHPSGGCLSAHYMKEFATGLEKETHTIPLYASPVRTKDLTDVDLWNLWEKSDSNIEFARAVIAADREKNK